MGDTNETEGVYLLYLLAVGRNSATFGIDTWCVAPDAESIEMMPAGEPDSCCGDISQRKTKETRYPSLANPDNISAILEDFDRAAAVIDTWNKLYKWLGSRSGQGWACFTEESAAALVPHWLSPGAYYKCAPSTQGGMFVDRWICPNLCSITSEALEGAVGNSPEELAPFWHVQVTSNMVITRQRIFA